MSFGKLSEGSTFGDRLDSMNEQKLSDEVKYLIDGLKSNKSYKESVIINNFFRDLNQLIESSES